ncbi:MAG: hypothetical protein L0211_18320 [Planctomycetaceae bacterium]|nr:hypothetical protein [Planctomycetaceae bacterium]
MSARYLRHVPRLEQLERRQVLANWGVSVVEGVLTIEGTNQNDRIMVCVANETGALNVYFNGAAPTLFDPASVDAPFTSIVINGNGGNDRVSVGEGVLLGATINGGAGNDWVWGGGGDDTIHGDHGNDHVYGRGGNDFLGGDAGNDKVWGGDGDDHMEGGDGHDHLHGWLGNDEGWGGNGFDHLHGDDGNDLLHGEAGKDHVYGGLGDDDLYGEDGNDLIYGQAGMDWIHGGAGKDKLWGGLDDDMIKGGWGNDHLNGNEGVNLLDGDEGFNHLWNGTMTELGDTPPEDWRQPDPPTDPPTDPPQTDPSFVTNLGDSTNGAKLVYQKVGGVDHTLEVSGWGFLPGEDLVAIINGTVLAVLTCDANGAFSVKYSSVLDQPGELSFEEFDPALNLVEGADVVVNGFSGVLNVTVPA